MGVNMSDYEELIASVERLVDEFEIQTYQGENK